MVHLYLFNPVQKLRVLSRLWFGGSKRWLKPSHLSVNPTRGGIIPASHSKPVAIQAPPPALSKNRIADQTKPSFPENACRDLDYYRDDSEGGFCIFLAEDTLFRVHRCLLLREPSTFRDMFSLPRHPESTEGSLDESAISLSDTADQVRDFLWALYAPPAQFCLYTNVEGGPSLEKLLNIAHMANKYCVSSYETWAMERIFILAQTSDGFLRKGSSELCAHVLNLAVLCEHQKLLEFVTQRLISRILWSDLNYRPVLEVAEHHDLRRLRGVAYYKELLDIEQVSYDEATSIHAVLAETMDPERGAIFLSAHRSIVSLWETLRSTSPVLDPLGCPMHPGCVASWKQAWASATDADRTLRRGSADVLGRLRSTMFRLRKVLPGMENMSISCTLAAMESISATRDSIIDGLLDHFCEKS